MDRFEGMQTQVVGLSVDSLPCLKAWAESLNGITYPLLSDFYPHGAVAQLYGVLRSDGTSERALFVIDKRGFIRYIDIHDIDQAPDNEELFRVLASIEPHYAPAPVSRPAPPPSPEPEADVVLYCTPWCPDCRRARLLFKENNIPFVEVDITRDRAAAQRVRGWANGNETTPTLKIKGEVIVGYKLDRIRQLLGIPPPY